MYVSGILIQQIEANGDFLSLRMSSTENTPLEIDKPEVIEGCNAPLRFKAKEHKNQYEAAFTNDPEPDSLPASTFQRNNQEISIKSHRYFGIPAETYGFSFYILSFPEYAIPRSLSIVNQLSQGTEYERGIVRDDQRSRYTIYVRFENPGQFNIVLTSKLEIDETGFSTSEYSDVYTKYDREGQQDWLYPMDNEKMRGKRYGVQEHFCQGRCNFRGDLRGQAGMRGVGGEADENGFRFLNGQAFYNGTDLRLPVGAAIEILQKLAENESETVLYSELSYAPGKSASDLLRRIIARINKALKLTGTPFKIESKRTFGYVLTPNE